MHLTLYQLGEIISSFSKTIFFKAKVYTTSQLHYFDLPVLQDIDLKIVCRKFLKQRKMHQ